MPVYKPAQSPYFQYDFQWKGARFHGSTRCTSRRDAERFEAEQRRRVALGDNARPAITVDEACGVWWQAKGCHLKSAATTEYQLGCLVTGLGKSALLGDITLREFDRYVARRRNGRANASVNREVELARRVWRWCAARGYDVPTIDWGKLLLTEPLERVRELTRDEEKKLFDALPESLRPVVEFALLTGQRRSEVINLRWSDVDLAGGRATLSTKGSRRHTIPLTPRLVALIANQPRVCAQVFTYVCLRPAPPRADRPRRLRGERYPFSEEGWTRHWQRALKAAGIADFRFHDLRHTAGTRALRATGNLKAVSKLLGHTDIKTTARYAHALEDDVRAMMEASDRDFAANHRNSPEVTKVETLKNRRNSRARA
jgi:integrase